MCIRDRYIIQPDKTLKAVGSAVLGDGKSIEIVDGKVALKGFGSALSLIHIFCDVWAYGL